MTLNKYNFDLLNSKYSLKMNVLSNSEMIEFELLHNQEELEAILNDMIKEVDKNFVFIAILQEFYDFYKSFSEKNSDLIERLDKL